MPYRRELRNRFELRIVSANQITTGQVRSARCHGIRLIAHLTICIFGLAFLGACNHTEYKSDGIRTAVRNDVTVGHSSAGTPVPARSLLVPQPAPNCEFVS